MPESTLLHELVSVAANRDPSASALRHDGTRLDYATLDHAVQGFAGGLMALGTMRADRVGIYLEKRVETVIASFGPIPLTLISRSNSRFSCMALKPNSAIWSSRTFV